MTARDDKDGGCTYPQDCPESGECMEYILHGRSCKTTPSHVAQKPREQAGPCSIYGEEVPSTTPRSVPADWRSGQFKAWKEQPGHEHAPWFLVTPNGCALRMGYHNDDAEDQRQAEWLAAACNAALGVAPDLKAYPNLQAVLRGTVSGHHTEWPMVRAELHKLLAAFVPSAIAPKPEVLKLADETISKAMSWIGGFICSGPGQEERRADMIEECRGTLAEIRRTDGTAEEKA